MVFKCKIFWYFSILWCVFFAVDCREALKPSPEIEVAVQQLIELQRNTEADINGPPCTLNVQKDLPKPNDPQPLYIVPNSCEFWLPNAEGQLQIPRGASIELYCASGFANSTSMARNQRIPKNTQTLKPTCLQHSTFQLRGEKYEFRQFVCAHPTKYKVEQIGETCTKDGAQIYRVGFNISHGGFMQTIRVCHDDATLRTHYAQYTLLPANLHFQRYVKRLNFSKAGYFAEHDINFLYKQQNQQQQAATLLGGGHAQFFDNNTFYLARGHLAAKADMIYANQQRSTFNFFNVAPQWQSFNGGQWVALEDETRKYVAKLRLSVECYTGTWGILELPTRDGQKHAFYLGYDANNNGLLPVPMLFYRVIVTLEQSRRGIALVGVNNPHVTIDDIRNTYIICEDVQEQVPWLRWIRNTNLKKGYIYACKVDEFASVVGHLPAHLADVKQLLIET